MANWTITGGSYSAATLEEADISGLRISLENGLGDSAEFFVPCDFDGFTALERLDDVSFSYGAELVFNGFVEEVCPEAQGGAEGVRVTCAGAGMRLERTDFTQQVAVDGGTARVGFAELGWDDDGERLNVAETLTDIIDSTESAHGIVSGTILTGHDVTAPPMEVVDVTCLAALRRVLRWVPDAVMWLDHGSGSVNITQPANLTAVSVASTGGGMVSVSPAARQRLAVSGVSIDWLTTTTVDGVATATPTQYTAGVTTGMDVVRVTIPLSGGDFQILKQEVKVEPVPREVADFTSLEWAEWLEAKVPELKGWNYDDYPDAFTVTNCAQEVDETNKVGLGSVPELDGLPAYPRQITGGAVPPWQAGVSAAPVRIAVTVRAAEEFAEVSEHIREVFRGESQRTFYLDCQGTDAEGIVYTQLVQLAGGEVPVPGLAAAWWAALNGEAPAFSCVLTTDGGADEGEPRLDIKPGVRLALTGDFPQASSPVQCVVHDVEEGMTTVTCGPQSRLTPADIVELRRAGSRCGSPVRNATGARRTDAAAGGREIQGAVAGRVTNTSVKPPEPVVTPFRATLASPGTVRIAPGKLDYMTVTDSASTSYFMCAELSFAGGELSGLGDGDIVCLVKEWEFSYNDAACYAFGGLDVRAAAGFWVPGAVAAALEKNATLGQANKTVVPLVTYRESGGVVTLEVIREGNVTLGMMAALVTRG